MSKFINLTPHVIHLPFGRNIPTSGDIVRCSEISTPVMVVDEINIIRKEFGVVINLPEPCEDTWLIVSMLVRQAMPHRKDLLSPGDLVRGSEGEIIGCLNLVCN